MRGQQELGFWWGWIQNAKPDGVSPFQCFFMAQAQHFIVCCIHAAGVTVEGAKPLIVAFHVHTSWELGGI